MVDQKNSLEQKLVESIVRVASEKGYLYNIELRQDHARALHINIKEDTKETFNYGNILFSFGAVFSDEKDTQLKVKGIQPRLWDLCIEFLEKFKQYSGIEYINPINKNTNMREKHAK